MTKLKLILLILLAKAAMAANIVGVLEIVPKDNVDELSVDELRHLTDELRRQATLALPQNNYTVLTRDNIIALIPADEKEAECLAESCSVDIGRAIGAEYVTQGAIGKFDKEYTLSIELYETMSGKLLGSIVMESAEIKDLLTAIRKQSPELFKRIKSESVPNPQSRIPKYVAISLDILGAAALGYGIYQHSQKKDLHRKYKNMPDGELPRKEYDNAYDRVNSAATKRDVGLILGGVLAGAGVMVHIWF